MMSMLAAMSVTEPYNVEKTMKERAWKNALLEHWKRSM